VAVTTRDRKDSRRNGVNGRAAKPKLLTVELLVCPICEHVGRLPSTSMGIKGYCTGPTLEPHKRVKRQPRTFREVRG
jgi:hypothetical protein